MDKLVVKRAFVFVGLLIICLAIWIIEVYHPFVCVDGMADATAWFDENGNGKKESGEPALAGACIWVWNTYISPGIPDAEELSLICDNPFLQTDKTGNWPNSNDDEWLFMPGADCNDIYIFASPPVGYQASTPLVVNDCYAEFGFALENTEVQHRVLSYADQMQRWEVIKWLKNAGILLTIVTISGVVSIKLGRSKPSAD